MRFTPTRSRAKGAQSTTANESRFHVMMTVIVIMALVITGRLFYWQVIRSPFLAQASFRQHWSRLKLYPNRGQILARDYAVLSGNKIRYDLYFDRQKLPNGTLNPQLATKLAPLTIKSIPPQVTELSKEDFNPQNEASSTATSTISPTPTDPIAAEIMRISNRLASQGSWIKLASKLTETQKKSIDELHFPELYFESQPARDYPEDTHAAHLLGFVGADTNGDPLGYFGLEGYYQLELAGRIGERAREQDAAGNPIPFVEERLIPQIDGRTLVTTIDRSVQYIAEKRLAQGMPTYEAEGGTVTIMDPKTGEILAMAGLPTYAPEYFAVFDQTRFSNPAVASSYEPGSIFKILVMSAALDAGSINTHAICPCSGPETFGPNVIRNWDDQYHPHSTLTDIIKNSDNIGMIYISRAMGQKNLLDGLSKFGIGQKTGIDLQDEMAIPMRPNDQWREIDLASASFGQGILVTPIQMVTATAAIAHQGILTKPHVVKAVLDQEKTIAIDPQPIRQAISAQTASTMTNIMSEAFKFFITNHYRKDLDGYRIAGKTGTAQVAVSGGYHDDKVIASFIGFAPAEDPKFVMLVTLNNPKSGLFASQTAAPLWFDIAKDLFTYWGIQKKL